MHNINKQKERNIKMMIILLEKRDYEFSRWIQISTLRFRPSQNPGKTKAIVIDKCATNLQIKL